MSASERNATLVHGEAAKAGSPLGCETGRSAKRGQWGAKRGQVQ